MIIFLFFGFFSGVGFFLGCLIFRGFLCVCGLEWGVGYFIGGGAGVGVCLF